MSSDLSLILSFEQSVFERNANKAYSHLIQLLMEVDSTGFHYNQNFAFNTKEKSTVNATRITSGIISLLSDKKFKINTSRYIKFLDYKKIIDSLFKVSGFSGDQNILSFFAQQYEKSSNSNLKQSNLFKMLVMMKLGDHSADSLNFLIELDKSISLPYILALLSSPVIFQTNENLIREKLLAFGSFLCDQRIEYQCTGLLAIAWMHTSYGIREDKHLFKSYLNEIMRNTLSFDNFVTPKIKSIDNTIIKPKILVLAEVFFSQHAMARCYSNYIIQLRRAFTVVLVAASDSVDDDILDSFDETLIFDQNKISVHEISQLIANAKPDIVFYPSIGMSTWVIALLSVRFAPLQIAATGHPATTLSETIDYLIVPEFLLKNPECYSERLLSLPNELDNTHRMPKNTTFPTPNINKSPKILKIAINGKSVKINPPLLSVCQNLNKQFNSSNSSQLIEWHFFTNETGLLHCQCEMEISHLLNNAIIYQTKGYEEYLESLSKCDIAMATFPFGGSNSNIDLLRLGIPLVYFTGKEAHSRTDEFYCHTFELIEGMASYSIEDVYANMERLISDNAYRVQLSEKIVEKNIESLLVNEKIDNKTDVIDAFTWVWRNHEKVIEKDIRFISYKDRVVDLQ